MDDYLIVRMGSLLNESRNDLDLIASKDREKEWKRDHYRYAFTVSVQKIYKLLNTPLTEKTAAQVKNSTKTELIVLTEIINGMIQSSRVFDLLF